ncbi:MAG: alpha/beta hydrolase [Anaerolineales bacterium]|nr:alpha/beta hydrolase [Anaerolineales bacterium]
MKTDNQIKLKDGRALGYAEYGDLSGKPVLQFHGWCSSRLEGKLPIIEQAANNLQVRLIVIERPGMGLSTFKPKRRLIDWVSDIVEFAEAIGLERFSVMGYSSGGPYALACALKVPERLTGVAILSGDPPHDVPEIASILDKQTRQFDSIADKAPWLFNFLLGMTFRKNRGSSVDQMIALVFPGELPPKDKEALSRPETPTWFAEMVREGIRPGSRGAAWDWTISARPWGFHLEDIDFEIHLFQGELEPLNPIAFGQYLASKLPNCLSKFYPDDGHLSLVCYHYEEILGAILN